MVTIVGGGPAGASLATFLSKDFDNITLYERNPGKRKPCGGGLTWRVVERYGDLLHLKEVEMFGCKEVYVDIEGKVVKFSNKKNLIYVVDRLNLDRHLRNLAENNGVKLRKKAVNPEEINDNIIVDSRGFAPGRKQGSLKVSICKMRNPKAMFVFRRNFVSEGHFWVFPIDENHASVGVGGVAGCIKVSLNDALNWFMKEIDATPKTNLGWLISFGSDFKNLIENKKIIKVGERAGLVNPATGEGIYYAIKSAHILSKCLKEDKLDSYERKLKEEWSKEFVFSELGRRMVPHLPRNISMSLIKLAVKTYLPDIKIDELEENYFNFSRTGLSSSLV